MYQRKVLELSIFNDYIEHGWKICKIEPGTKGPRTPGWNEVGNAVQDPTDLAGAGLMHTYSGTCALDLDRLDESAEFLQKHNVILADLLADPKSVQILSGRANRGKLIYALPTPLPSKSLCEGAFELRCGTANGRTMQDVLPPSIHPDTGKPYEWKGDWRNLPPIPPALLALWQLSVVRDKVSVAVRNPPTGGTETTLPILIEIKDLLTRRSPNCGYKEWIDVAMAIHHESGGSDEGFAIWDEWSAAGDKYPGIQDLRGHWASIHGSETPLTVDSLRRMDTASADKFEDVSGAAAWPEDVLEARPLVSGFQFLSLVELFKRPEPEWIIEGILPEAAFGAIYGQHSAGKTFTACDLALSVALGHPWRGRPAKQGPILYIAAEDDRGVQMRFAAGLAARGVQDAPIRVLPAAPVLTDKAQGKALLEAIKREKKPSIVFFDTLAAVTPGSDENAAQAMGELVSYCYKIHKLTGALVLIIHHEGKTPGRGMRGSSALPGACEVILEVSKDEVQHEMRVEKVKNAENGAIFNFRLLPMASSCIVEWL